MDEDTRLVIGVGEEDHRFFGGKGGIAFDEGGHDTTSSLDTEGKRRCREGVNPGLLGSVFGKNGDQDSSTIGDSLVRIDALVGLLAIEKVRHELDDMGIQVELLTTISCTLLLSILESWRTLSMGL